LNAADTVISNPIRTPTPIAVKRVNRMLIEEGRRKEDIKVT
jgi:hypothetical protein